jgi:hypothetical protein
MSEEKKKLGVEDLVEAQRETAEQLKIIAERLDWICDAESEPTNYGMVWFWMVPMILYLLAAMGVAAREPLGSILSVIAISLVCLVALSFKDRAKTVRRQCLDRLADLEERKQDEAFLRNLPKKK